MKTYAFNGKQYLPFIYLIFKLSNNTVSRAYLGLFNIYEVPVFCANQVYTVLYEQKACRIILRLRIK